MVGGAAGGPGKDLRAGKGKGGRSLGKGFDLRLLPDLLTTWSQDYHFGASDPCPVFQKQSSPKSCSLDPGA